MRTNTSKEAYDLCVGKEGERLRNPKHDGQKKRHTIMSRSFVFVKNGDVDHLTIPELKPVKGIKSHFCFTGKSGSQGELEFTERSCYVYSGCFNFDTSKCQHKQHTGPLSYFDMQDNTNPTPQTRTAFQALAKKAKKLVKQNTNLVIRLRVEDGAFCLARATGKVRKLTGSEMDKNAKSILGTNHLADVVFVWQYAEEARGSSSATYTLEAERCGELRECCSCDKQHMSVYKASCIRELIGFTLKVPVDNTRLHR